MSTPHEGQAHHTTTVGAWRCCNFCGASRCAATHEPITHFEGCCVPKGQNAIDAELRIISNLAADRDDD